MVNTQALNTLGTIGGVSIALSLVPQVIRTYRTKSAYDISYVYQAIYIFGTTLVNIYAISLNLWVIYVPCLIEEALIISLTVMKYFYDKNDVRNSVVLKKEGDGQVDDQNSIAGSKTGRQSSNDGGDEDLVNADESFSSENDGCDS